MSTENCSPESPTVSLSFSFTVSLSRKRNYFYRISQRRQRRRRRRRYFWLVIRKFLRSTCVLYILVDDLMRLKFGECCYCSVEDCCAIQLQGARCRAWYWRMLLCKIWPDILLIVSYEVIKDKIGAGTDFDSNFGDFSFSRVNYEFFEFY